MWVQYLYIWLNPLNQIAYSITLHLNKFNLTPSLGVIKK